MRNTAAAAAVVIFSLLLAPSLYSQEAGPAPESSPVKKVELVVFDAGAPDAAGRVLGHTPGSIRVGFYVELEPGWHLYWANPGDAGLAPAVRWTLPPGFQAGLLRHPVPGKSVDGDIVSYEHGGPVLLTCDITPAPGHQGGGAWEASAVLEWMTCKESCVTGETAVRASFPPDDDALRRGREIAEAFAHRFPRPLSEAGLSVQEGHARRSGEDWIVELALSGSRAGEVSDFYPYPLEGFVFSHSRIIGRGGKIIVPLTPSRGSGAPPPATVAGLVIVGGAGYEVMASVGPSRPGYAHDTQHIPSWRTHHE